MTSIFVAKLDFGVDDQQLNALFSEYGRVLKATVALDRETKKSRGFGFVEMADADEAAAAISALDGHRINGRPIAVKEAEDRGNKRPPRGGGDRKPFNNDRRGGGDRRPQGDRDSRPGGDRPPRDSRPPSSDSPRSFTPAPDLGSDSDAGKGAGTERKKDREPKKKDKPKTHKMEAYKKSGKNNIFIDDEDEEPLSLFDYGDDDEDFDTSYLVNNDEDYDDDEEWEDEED